MIGEGIEFGVPADAVEDGEEGVAGVGGGFGVGGVVEVFMPVIITASCEREALDRQRPATQLLRIAQVDERVAEAGNEVVD